MEASDHMNRALLPLSKMGFPILTKRNKTQGKSNTNSDRGDNFPMEPENKLVL